MFVSSSWPWCFCDWVSPQEWRPSAHLPGECIRGPFLQGELGILQTNANGPFLVLMITAPGLSTKRKQNNDVLWELHSDKFKESKLFRFYIFWSESVNSERPHMIFLHLVFLTCLYSSIFTILARFAYNLDYLLFACNFYLNQLNFSFSFLRYNRHTTLYYFHFNRPND